MLLMVGDPEHGRQHRRDLQDCQPDEAGRRVPRGDGEAGDGRADQPADQRRQQRHRQRRAHQRAQAAQQPPGHGAAAPARRLRRELTAQGHRVSADTVGRLLKARNYSLQGNRKR